MTASSDKPEPEKPGPDTPGPDSPEPENKDAAKPAADKPADEAAGEPADAIPVDEKPSDAASDEKASDSKAGDKKAAVEKAADKPSLDKKSGDDAKPSAGKRTAADTPPPGKGTGTAKTAAASQPEAIKAIPVRHYGRWVSAVLVLGLLALLVNAFATANVNYSAIPDYLFNSTVVEGLGKTILISVLAMLLGLVLGILLAVMRLSKNPVTSSVSWAYIWFFRGTPVYVQLLLWFNLALIFPYINLGFIYRDEMSDFMTPFMAALLGLGLNEAAYMSEIVRAGIQSVDEGQTEASHALGMNQSKTLRRIVLPQAMRVIVPPTGNEFINMLKTSSLAASAAQYLELLRSTSDIGQTTGATVEMLFLAATWYLILTSVFSVGQYYLERHYARGSLRSLPLTPWQKVKKNLATVGHRSPGGMSA